MATAPQPNAATFLTIDEACRYLNVGRTKLHDLMNCGQLPAKKIGTRRLIARRDLDILFNSLPDYAAQPARSADEG